MKAIVLANFHLVQLTCAALLIFFAVFIGVLFWINRRQSKRLYDYMSNMPLEDK